MFRNVPVTERTHTVEVINPTGNVISLGVVTEETYGDAEARRYNFHPSTENPFSGKKKVYKLGVGTARASFLNPADAQKVLQAKGYKLQDLYIGRGGLNVMAQYAHPEIKTDDTIQFDRSLFRHRKNVDELDSIHLGVQIVTNLQLGHMALSMDQGLYRLVCTNGLFDSLLKFPSMNVRHNDWEVEKMEEQLSSTLTNEITQIKPAGGSASLKKATNLIDKYLREIEQGKLSPEMSLLEEQFSGFYQTSLPSWVLPSYSDLLTKFVQQELHETYTALDLINIYTSAVNSRKLRQGDRGILRALAASPQVVRSTITLANLAALFA